jgi:hypothetical protein
LIIRQRAHPDVTSFVEGLYQAVLGRRAKAKELVTWEQFARNHPDDRLSLVKAFLARPKARKRLLSLFLQPPSLGEATS